VVEGLRREEVRIGECGRRGGVCLDGCLGVAFGGELLYNVV
jgi:hypothetical protein